MALSAIVSWTPGTTFVANRGFATRSSGQMRKGSSPDAPEQDQPAHPTVQWSVAKIIEHVAGVHHRFLRDTLTDLSQRFSESAGQSPECSKQWNALKQRFSKLRDEMLRCLLHEEADVFPQLLRLEGSSGSDPPPALRSEVEAIERRHALCLQMLWRLLCATRDQMNLSPEFAAGQRISKELSALCDDFEQQLFEKECLLFVKVASARIRKPR
jgi:iron-sulfur cluster repair protein YtfE (RIC family)